MVTRKDYTAEAVKAAHSVLIELMHALGEHRENIVLIGGWVPDILLGEMVEPHVGSIDVDLALDHRKMKEEGYRTIRELLIGMGYKEGRQPFIFERKVKMGEREIIVEVDFLAGEYGGTGEKHRHQKIQEQGMRPRKARGADLVFDNPKEATMEGRLPYQNYPVGIDALVEEFRPHVGHGLVKEGLEKIAEQFASEKHVGPKFVADFEEVTDSEEREILERDAYEQVNFLLEKLGLK